VKPPLNEPPEMLHEEEVKRVEGVADRAQVVPA
jgi:hypothetical protein